MGNVHKFYVKIICTIRLAAKRHIILFLKILLNTNTYYRRFLQKLKPALLYVMLLLR